MTATEITRTGYSSKNIFRPIIDQSLHPTGCMPWITLHLWGFLCIRDAGHWGNKTAVLHCTSRKPSKRIGLLVNVDSCCLFCFLVIMIDNQLFQNILLLSCDPIGELCLVDHDDSSCTVSSLEPTKKVNCWNLPSKWNFATGVHSIVIILFWKNTHHTKVTNLDFLIRL